MPDILSVKDLEATGLPHDARHEALFKRVLTIYAPKPVNFTLRPRVDGMREHRESLQIWIDPAGKNPAYTLAHELAHCISTPLFDSPTMPVSVPADGSLERRFIGELISLFDHPRAHDILREAGFADDVRAESVERSRFFLEEDLPTCKDLTQKPNSLAIALGFANMIVTYQDPHYLPKIEREVKARRLETFAVGKIFAHEAGDAPCDDPDETVRRARRAAAVMSDNPDGGIFKHSEVFPETDKFGQNV